MGNTCRALATVYGILGAIGTIVMSYTLGRTAEIGRYSVDYERNWILTIAIFGGVGLSVAMVTVALYTLGEIYDKVYSGGYVVNNGLSKEAEEGLSALGKEAEENRIISNGGWKCPDCGKVHYSYETTCQCGRGKND